MAITFKPYPSTKVPSIEWLGEIPAHWHAQRLHTITTLLTSGVDKHQRLNEEFVSLCNYVDVYKNDYINEDLQFMSTTATKSEIDKFHLLKGDVVITKSSELWNDIGVPALITTTISGLICGYGLAILRPKNHNIISGFLLRVLQSKAVANQFNIKSKGVTRYALRHIDIKSIQIPLPSIQEQKVIVRYLDYMDQRIQKFVQVKKKLVELFKEQKQAIIHSAVTRGLDSITQFKDSGIEWLGEIPEHWTTSFAKSHYEIQLGKMLQSVQINVSDKKVLYFKAQHVQWFSIQNSNLPTMWATPKEIQQFSVHSGDLLVCEGGEGGRCGLVKFEPEKNTIIQNALHRVRPLKHCSNDYLQYIMASISARGWFEAINSKATISHFTVEKFATLKIPIAPLHEQTAIVDFLNEATEKIDSNINLCSHQIDLMQEYRTRLISDVVTGKLDVREAALNLPQDNDDPDTLNQPQ